MAATPAIAEKFPPERTVTLLNYALPDEWKPAPAGSERPNLAVYAGSINSHRNIEVLVEAIGLLPAELDARLLLLGELGRAEPGFRQQLERLPGWARTEYGGELSREELAVKMAGARVGLNVLGSTPHHTVAIGNKMFEYMAAGLPQVYSDFPLWREMVGGQGLGMAVEPSDPVAVAGALRYLFEHPEEAEAMGRRARAAVEERYNWESQEPALLELYDGPGGAGEHRAADARLVRLAPVAQLDRASVYGTEGQRFESSRARSWNPLIERVSAFREPGLPASAGQPQRSPSGPSEVDPRVPEHPCGSP